MKLKFNLFAKRYKNVFVLIPSIFILTVSFQNCSPGSFESLLSRDNENAAKNEIDESNLPSSDSVEMSDESAVSSLTKTAVGKSFYVAKNGNDSYSCLKAQSRSTPKKTIASAVSCQAAGDTVWVGDGVYNERIGLYSSVRIKPGTSTSSRTTIRAINRRKVIIQPRSTVHHAVLIGSAPYIALIGLVIDATYLPGSAVKIESNSHSILLEDNEMRNAKGQGILVQQSPKGILRKSRIHHNGRTKYDHGMYLNSGSNDWVIENNEFDRNSQMGIQIYAQPKRTKFRANFLHDNCQVTKSGAELFVAHQDQIAENNLIWVTGSCTNGITVNLQSPARSILRGNHVYCKSTTSRCLSGISVEASAINTVVQDNTVLGFSKNIVNKGIGTILRGNSTTGSQTATPPN